MADPHFDAALAYGMLLYSTALEGAEERGLGDAGLMMATIVATATALRFHCKPEQIDAVLNTLRDLLDNPAVLEKSSG